MEILLVYLYGIYDSVSSVIGASMIIIGMASVTALAVHFSSKDLASLYDEKEEKHKEHMKKASSAKRFILIKTFIVLLILDVLIPPKEIAVAMVAAPTVVKTVNSIVDSNRTTKMVNIIDLSLDKVIKKLEEK